MSGNAKTVRRAIKHLVLMVGAIALSGCAETQFLTNAVKIMSRDETSSSVPGGGVYKVGNPYQINNIWYYPAEDWDYDETGIASWYGPKFHGRKTANGAIFDMNAVSAAHKTLPLPSFVRVTNLENGRSIDVMVNDRGPYAHNRIIDMSKRAAQLLDFERQGTTRVRVQLLKEPSLAVARAANSGTQIAAGESPITVDKLPKPSVASEDLAPPPGGTATTPSVGNAPIQVASLERPSAVSVNGVTANQGVTVYPVGDTSLWVQAGAFSRFDNANRVKMMLSEIGNVHISNTLVDGRDFYRVRIGPLVDTDTADVMLQKAVNAGYPGARIVVGDRVN